MGAVAITVDTESEAPPPEPAPPRVPTWTLIGFAIGGLVLLGIAALAIAWQEDPVPPRSMWSGRLIEPPPERPSTDLVDTSGAPFDLATATAGELTLVFFGYTNCPDICSVQMATLKQSLDRVEVPAKVVFVTTDPERDTPERLRSWLDSFDPSFVGVTGSPAAIARAQQDLGVTVAVPDPVEKNGEYTVGHSSAVYVFTADDRAHLAYPAGTRQESWANDLPRIADEADWQAAS
jgi:protein SCO1/2